MTTPNFSEMLTRLPAHDELESTAILIARRWKDARSTAERLSVLADWNRERIEFETEKSIAMVRYQIDTSSTENREAQSHFDLLTPEVEVQYLEFLKDVLSSADRPELERELGSHVFSLWERFVESCDPAVVDAKKRIAELCTEYSAVTAGVKIDFRGESYNLSSIRALFSSDDRKMRHDAFVAVDEAMGSVSKVLDGLYDQLVSCRQDVAERLGFETYTPVGYGAMYRTDYGPDEVANFRKQIREIVVPLATKVRQRQAERLGLSEDYCHHDEYVQDRKGVPLPKGDHDWMLGQAQIMFDDLGSDFSEFFSTMREHSLLDLISRDGKAGGGFCISFDRWEVPFIFANFNGTQDDVLVFTHECGHAFQTWSCRPQPVIEYNWPTYEACEIHSMGFEFLTWPYMDLFFGEDGDRFRRGHLEGAILFLPYGAMVDEFQHEVYANPNMSAEERCELWLKLERVYQPHRKYKETPNFETGRWWHRQGHIFSDPFYYIDYCLAQTCALQLWQLAETDHDKAMDLFRRLCKLGGSMSFTKLLQEVGIKSPFVSGTLQEVCDEVSLTLSL